MTVSAYHIELPADGGAGGPVVWLETNAAWEQVICVFEEVQGNWVTRGVVSGNGENGGGRWEVFTIGSSTISRNFLVWILHKRAPYAPHLRWENSKVKLLHHGSFSGIDIEHPQYRDKTISVGGEDSNDGDYNDGIAHFTYTSHLGSAKVEPFNKGMPDGWFIAPKAISV